MTTFCELTLPNLAVYCKVVSAPYGFENSVLFKGTVSRDGG
jgi:hypothetical protein